MNSSICCLAQAYARAVSYFDTAVGMGGDCTVHVDVAMAG